MPWSQFSVLPLVVLGGESDVERAGGGDVREGGELEDVSFSFPAV